MTKHTLQASSAVNWLRKGLRLLSRSRRNGRTRELELIESISLGGRRQMALVRCGSDEFLVGLSGDGVTSIVKTRSVETSS